CSPGGAIVSCEDAQASPNLEIDRVNPTLRPDPPGRSAELFVSELVHVVASLVEVLSGTYLRTFVRRSGRGAGMTPACLGIQNQNRCANLVCELRVGALPHNFADRAGPVCLKTN